MRAVCYVILISFMTFNAFAQQIKETPELPIDADTKKITFTEVVTLSEDVPKDKLYSKAREWFATTYKSSNAVLQMQDKEDGKLVGKALMQVYHRAMGKNYDSGYINYTISISVKDNRYKYEITDFHHTGQLVSGGQKIQDYGVCEEMINTTHKTMGASHQKLYNYYLLQLKENIEALITSLKSEMANASASKDKEDW